MIKLSVAIIAFNEENNIERCINSVKDIADEILVVDSYSTDKTEAICLRMGAKVIKNPFKGHIEQKNFALKETSSEYVLSLDADEALDELLQKNIKAAKEDWQADGYQFNRLTNYGGHWVKHCGWYPDRKLRLFHKNKGCWGGTNPHDIVEMEKDSNIKKLGGNLLHYSYKSVTDHISQTNYFTTIAATALFKNGKRSSIFKIATRPFLQFVRDYFLFLGFLDGRNGFYICYINALSAFLKYVKIKELQDGKDISL
ncbi:MAG: glycosyltransferase family 2 protein [Halobacteriovoraceae bacterium]|jgi:glycosyltransferase involved in cell wall biosynthesis|nr:glycosyltransferase family 2 protein [Halobacteriovoraceae bacterium]MBT5093650.1 glycosyltransferase family 2 protein [Halobacteriovoraceae bacterium]